MRLFPAQPINPQSLGRSEALVGHRLMPREIEDRRIALSHVSCDAKMYHMKKASVRDLRYRFSVVENLLRDGHEIQITKRKRVIARLLPPEPTIPVEMPDFLGRMEKIFGKKRMKVSGAEQLAAERERF